MEDMRVDHQPSTEKIHFFGVRQQFKIKKNGIKNKLKS